MRHQGRSNFEDVIKHYAEGFAAQGYQQNLLSATSTEERHEYIRGGERFSLIFSAQERDVVTVNLSAPLFMKTRTPRVN